MKFREKITANRITLPNWEFEILVVLVLLFGITLGTYITLFAKWPSSFALTQDSVTRDSSTDFNQGTYDQTEVSGTGSAAYVQLQGSGGAGWLDNNWNFRRPIQITNTGSVLTNYQVDVSVTYDAGMQPDFDDIRFANSSGSELDFWLKQKSDSTDATFIVEVDTIASSSTTTIYMYYGNSGASSMSNAQNTFLHFVNFNTDGVLSYGGSQDTQSSSYEILDSGNTLRIYGNSWKVTNANFTVASGQLMQAEFRSAGDDAEINGIGFDTDTNLSPNWLYQITGTQSYGNYSTVPQYSGSGNYETVNAVLDDFTGTYPYILLPNDADAGQNTNIYYSNIRIRKYTATAPSVSTPGSEESALAPSGTWTSPSNGNVIDLTWNDNWGDGTGSSTAFEANIANVGANSSIQFWARVGTSIANMAGNSYISIGTATSGTSFSLTKDDLDGVGLATGNNRYIQIRATLSSTDGVTNPQLDSFTIYYMADDTAPSTNASNISMQSTNGGDSVSEGEWTNSDEPYFTWDVGSDDDSGVKGYCLYLGTDSNGDPATSKGMLGTSPVSLSGATCGFIIATNSIDFATSSYQGNTWITSSNDQYYLNIKTIDVANNIYPTSESFAFKLDNTPPTNPIGLSAPQGFLRNIDSFTIAWATTESNMATDTHSGIAGYQYKINDSGEWYGTNHSGSEDCTDLLTSSTYVLDETFDTLVTGENTFYFRTWDTACNTSTDPLVAILKYNADAPSAPQNLTVTPATNTANAFSFNWQEPETFQGSANGLSYCYTVNTIPSPNTCTFTSQATLATDAYATQPGENRLYVASKDEAGNINYSDYASVVFTANTPAPGSPTDIDVADVSIKNKEAWRLTASWLEPENTGAGIASYRIYRSNLKTECSSDSSAFEQIATTSGTSYVDSDLTQQDYYYCVRACDSANNCSAVSGTATGYPDGKYTVPAPLLSGPAVIGVSTRQATVEWLTERTADSRVAYGLTSGNYFEEEPSNSNHVTTHSITLNNLDPGTTYYYVAKWTDEDGNTGTSEEKSFTTQPAPTVKSVSVPTIGLDAALIRFTTQNASKVRIYYGPTTAFGGATDVATSITESSYTAVLDGLSDGTLYNFKINAFDTDGFEYEGTILDFTTIPRPELSNIRLQQITGTAQPSVLVTWDSNTEVSSIVRYYPEDNSAAAQDSVEVERISGEHRAVISGLLPQTSYNLIVLGQDRLGNEARSDVQRFTTATDTRPPGISNLQVNSSIIKNEAGENSAQIAVSWNTDEPTTAQVEFGEGTGTTYAQSTQEDTNLTFNHLVVISGLSPSKVYHLRALSKDSAGNLGQSIDTVTITPKATDNALDLVIRNLQQIFGFLGNL